MRISGGAARGINLLVPRGDAVRPATDGMRQAVFSSLGPLVADARFLDLFAGSGAYGLEALSRGAAGGAFVEKNHKAAVCLRRNIESVCRSLGRSSAGLTVLTTDVLAFPDTVVGSPDLVFADPPYELVTSLGPAVFERLARMPGWKPGALVLLELPGELALAPPGWACVKRLGKGVRQPTVMFFQRLAGAAAAPG